MKRFIGSCISILLILSVFVIPTINFAGYHEGRVYLDSYNANGYSLYARPIVKSYDDLIDKQKNIYDSLKNRRNISFGIDKGVNIDYATQLYNDVINDFEDFFYVATSFGYSEYFGRITEIRPDYVVSTDNFNNAQSIFNAGMNKAMTVVDDSMTDLQKALVLHDYVINHSVYGDTNLNITRSAWGFFNNGRVVCAGYTIVYSYLLHRAGIESDYVFSRDMGHAWNAVKVDGSWYYVDLTYDGQTLDSGYPEADGMVMHRWFMKSENYMAGDKGLGHRQFMSYDYPNDGTDNLRATGNQYDDYFWDDIATNILVVDSKFYYLQPNYNAGYGKLSCRDRYGNETYVTGGSFYCTKGSITMSGGGYSITNGYMYGLITYHEGKCIVSTNNAIQAVPIVTSGYGQIIDYTNNRNNASTYSLYIEDNQVCYKLVGSYNVRTMNKMDYFHSNISTRSNYNLFYYCDVDNNGVVNAKDYLIIRAQNRAAGR